MSKPLIFCLPSIEKMIEVIDKLDNYQKQHKFERLVWPDDLFDKKPVTMSPGVEEEYLDDVAREMSQAPSRSRGDR